MLAFHSDIKNTSRSIFQLKNELFLMLIKMRIGTSLSFTFIISFLLTYIILIEFPFLCRLKDKYHPTNLLTVIERYIYNERM